MLFRIWEDLFLYYIYMAAGFLNQVSVKGRLYDIAPVCDTELDENSENAVQNKVVTEALNNITQITNLEIDSLFGDDND